MTTATRLGRGTGWIVLGTAWLFAAGAPLAVWGQSPVGTIPTVAPYHGAPPVAAPPVGTSATPPAVSDGDWNSVLQRLSAAESELRELRAAQGTPNNPFQPASQPRQLAPEVAPLGSPMGNVLGTGASPSIYNESLLLDETPEEFFGGGEGTSGRPTVRVRGRMIGDTLMASQDADNVAEVGNIRNAFAFRQLRIGAQGEAYDNMFYQIDFEFADVGRPSFRSTYFGFNDVPVLGIVFIGRMKESFSLEQMPSEEHVEFVERSLANSLVPGRNTGVRILNGSADKRMTWSLGTFFDSTDEYGSFHGDRGALAVTGRSTWLAWYDEPADGRYLLHLGASFSARSLTGGTVRYNSRPETQAFRDELGVAAIDNFVTTRFFPADSSTVLGTEFAWEHGSLTVQSEYVLSRVARSSTGGDDVNFWGGYIQASYFLTGEHRPYDRIQGQFARVRPFERFFVVETTRPRRVAFGTGAWEVAARLSHLDLDSQDIDGGRLTDVTCGLNWFWNPRSRMMFNYIHAFLDRDSISSNADLFVVRYQFSF